jgi:hypothetical protein
MKRVVFFVAGLASVQLTGCASVAKNDLAHYPFPEAQEEVRSALQGVFHDAKTANVEGLRARHLHSEKFTKFGTRMFERQTIEFCDRSEAGFITKIREPQWEARDLKIDVFGEVAIATFYFHNSFRVHGDFKQGIGRQTIVFVKTADGWKIVHEHRTGKGCFDQ